MKSNFFYLFLFQLTVISCYSAHAMPARCEHQLRREYGHYIATMSDHSQQQHAIATLRTQRSSMQRMRFIQEVHVRQCPATVPESGSLSERSTCPWQERDNIAENRYPKILADVQCICEHCIGSESHNLKRACEKISYPVPVFYLKNSVDCTYDIVEEHVGFGCMCAGKKLNGPARIPRGSGRRRR